MRGLLDFIREGAALAALAILILARVQAGARLMDFIREGAALVALATLILGLLAWADIATQLWR